jgi:putative transposase
MPIKRDITDASDALWSAAVERERVIVALAAAPQVSRSEVEQAAQKSGLSRAMVYRLVARSRRDPRTSTLLNHSPGRRPDACSRLLCILGPEQADAPARSRSKLEGGHFISECA